ncbi:MAG: phosphate/phosphite/phosphonate ABC transporter substrate-binding protein [Desulfobulbaceae bacterium]|nr:phosphate/phosphite/phosphonate ABC transporter substrate-binding protein [Desulfobulbaceae bacterium]HIJ78560.1 phosphate/phosphite/phosphonate ABC transporter substrate-binding protein [Deltaproteobacteria bacterium]
MKKKYWVAYKTLVVVCVICALQVTQVSAREGREMIKFGVYPYKSPHTLVKLFSPIAKRIETTLGVKVQLVTAPDFDAYIARGKQGEYDLALPCVNCFFQIQPAGYSVIAKGEPSFYGGTIVRKDSGIVNVAQLKGKRIASVGKHSYAAHLFLLDQLHEAGVDPMQDVHFQFLGKLDTIILGVLNKKYEAGTVRTDALENPIFKEIRHELKFISQSSPIPQFPFVVKQDLPLEQVSKIQAVLVGLSLDNAEDKEILKSMRLTKISPATDADYDAFRKKLTQAQALSH